MNDERRPQSAAATYRPGTETTTRSGERPPRVLIEIPYEGRPRVVVQGAHTEADERRVRVWVRGHPPLARLVSDALRLGKVA
jgi:hypothetical protein